MPPLRAMGTLPVKLNVILKNNKQPVSNTFGKVPHTTFHGCYYIFNFLYNLVPAQYGQPMKS
jgi:hypothetical protein